MEAFFDGLAQLDGGPKPALVVVGDDFSRLTSAWAVLPDAVRRVAVDMIVTLAASLERHPPVARLPPRPVNA